MKALKTRRKSRKNRKTRRKSRKKRKTRIGGASSTNSTNLVRFLNSTIRSFQHTVDDNDDTDDRHMDLDMDGRTVNQNSLHKSMHRKVQKILNEARDEVYKARKIVREITERGENSAQAYDNLKKAKKKQVVAFKNVIKNYPLFDTEINHQNIKELEEKVDSERSELPQPNFEFLTDLNPFVYGMNKFKYLTKDFHEHLAEEHHDPAIKEKYSQVKGIIHEVGQELLKLIKNVLEATKNFNGEIKFLKRKNALKTLVSAEVNMEEYLKEVLHKNPDFNTETNKRLLKRVNYNKSEHQLELKQLQSNNTLWRTNE